MANKIDEIRRDIQEMESFEKQANRQRVKDVLSIEIHKCKSDILKLEEQLKVPCATPLASSAVAQTNRYEVKLNNYAWDQTNKFVKFYVTLTNVHIISEENVHCEFTNRSLNLTVKNLDNKNFSFKISNLLKPIVPEQSTWKIKNDMVIINAAKDHQENWSHVTEWEKKASDAQKVDTDNMDPADGLMSLMKNMYEKGDDEMKRTIAKAWTESQRKGSPI